MNCYSNPKLYFLLRFQSVSPELLECRNLELAVPGTYRAGKILVMVGENVMVFCVHTFIGPCFHISDSSVVTIASFAPQLEVITSKQRPRKLTIHGNNGEDYAFLLKGHEDLRQDERVMQVFPPLYLICLL